MKKLQTAWQGGVGGLVGTLVIAIVFALVVWTVGMGLGRITTDVRTGSPKGVEKDDPYACIRYVTDVLDLHAQGYTAKQITATFAAASAYDEDLFNGCGTPTEVIKDAS